jgi:hypothetical protein
MRRLLALWLWLTLVVPPAVAAESGEAVVGEVAAAGGAPEAVPGPVRLRVSGLLHAGGIDYGRATYKERGYSVGSYLLLGWGGSHDLELDVTGTRVEYVAPPDLRQRDWCAAYTYTRRRSYGRIGFHYISSDDRNTDGGRVFFGGLAGWGGQLWSGGLDAALSLYRGSSSEAAVLQFAPWWSWRFASLSGRRALSATTTLIWIHLDRDSFLVPSGTPSSDYLSAAINLNYEEGRLGLNLQAWGGEQSYAVRRRGFVVYNLAEIRTGGFGGSVSWSFGRHLALKAGVHHEYLREYGALDPLGLTALNLALGVWR